MNFFIIDGNMLLLLV